MKRSVVIIMVSFVTILDCFAGPPISPRERFKGKKLSPEIINECIVQHAGKVKNQNLDEIKQICNDPVRIEFAYTKAEEEYCNKATGKEDTVSCLNGMSYTPKTLEQMMAECKKNDPTAMWFVTLRRCVPLEEQNYLENYKGKCPSSIIPANGVPSSAAIKNCINYVDEVYRKINEIADALERIMPPCPSTVAFVREILSDKSSDRNKKTILNFNVGEFKSISNEGCNSEQMSHADSQRKDQELQETGNGRGDRKARTADEGMSR